MSAIMRQREFRLLAVGQLASNLGDGVYAVALPWYVLSHGGSAVLLGTALAAYGVPRTLLIPVGGVLADRWGSWTVMLGADLLRAAAVGALAAVAVEGATPHAVLVIVASILGLGEGLFIPGSYAIVPDLVCAADLHRANAVSTASNQTALLVGPAAGGVLVAAVGASASFAVDSVTFVVSAMTLAGIHRRRRATPASAAPDEHTSVLRLLRCSRVLQIVLVTTFAANLGSGAMSEVALPVLARDALHAGADGYGLLIAAFGVGALAGTLLGGHRETPTRPAVTGGLLFLAEAAAFGLVPVARAPVLAAAALAGAGVGNGAGNLLTVTAFQRWVPPAVRGRLISVTMLCSMGVFPLSTWLGGLLVHAYGPASVFWGGSAVLAVAILGSLTQPEWRAFGSVDEQGAGTVAH